MKRSARGMVTAETAVVMPFVVLVAVTLLWVVTLGVTQMRVSDSAREGARAAARGEPADVVRRTVREHLSDASVRVTTREGHVEVRVRARTSLPLFPRAGVTLAGRAVAALE